MGRWFEPNSRSHEFTKPRRRLTLRGFSFIRAMVFLGTFDRFFRKTFVLWMLVAAFFAYVSPPVFSPLAPWVSPLLGFVMFTMGLTLKVEDFKEIVRRPKDVLVGVAAQYVLMPLTAWAICCFFDLPKEIALGLLLVAVCPGGTSSNVLTFLAKGDVALSVTLTSCTTLLSPIVTPCVLSLLAHQWITINTMAMCISILEIVLLPVAAGVTLNTLYKDKIARVTKALPALSMVTIILIIAVVVSLSAKVLASTIPIVCLAVVLLNFLGLLLGFLVGKVFHMPWARRSCISLEVGTQNAGLGATLATIHFAAMPMVAIPSAIYSVWNIVAGTFAAEFFRAKKH